MLMIMLYYVKVTAIVNEIMEGSFTTYNYESSIKTTLGHKHWIPKELKIEILEWAKNKFNETNIKFDNIVIEEFTYSHQGIIWMQDRGIQISEDMNKIYEISKKEYQEYQNSKEGRLEYLINMTIPRVVQDIKNVIQEFSELEMLDSQEYLNFMDVINQLSIDQDRPDSK